MDARNIRRHADEVRIKIGGPAGFGIKAAGQTLARSFMHAGLWTFDLTEYPSLIKGGHNVYALRVSSEPVSSHVAPVDILVALASLTADVHRHEVVKGGAVIFDPTRPPSRAAAATCAWCRCRSRSSSRTRAARRSCATSARWAPCSATWASRSSSWRAP